MELATRAPRMGRQTDARRGAASDDRSVPDADPLHTVTELIEHGRDREAAERGASASRTPRTVDHLGGPMDVLSQLDQLAPLLVGVVGRIRSEQLDDPTPCDDFTV